MADLFSQPEPESQSDADQTDSENRSKTSESKSNKTIGSDRHNAAVQGTTPLFNILEKLLQEGMIASEDVEFPRWLRDRLGEGDPSVLLAAAHLTSLTRQGHVGTKIPLRRQHVPLFGHNGERELAEGQENRLEHWLTQMEKSLEASEVVGSPDEPDHPLILDRGYLYYQRYWSYERELARRLRALSESVVDRFDGKGVGKWIKTLFPGGGEEGSRWQRLALWMALRRQLLVLTGGPGTGKTYTLIRMVALQLLLGNETQNGDQQDNWDVALAAPTGKAAARINESITDSLKSLQSQVPEEIMDRLPRQARTIHRLLGPRRHRPDFRHNEENPLPHDVVVVDEASMVDIALMTKLTGALKPGAQLILIGDKDQLASVEAGSVLGDICTPRDLTTSPEQRPINIFSADFGDEMPEESGLHIPYSQVIQQVPPLLNCMVELTRSRRFENAPGIGELAEHVKRNEPEQAVKQLQSADEVHLELPETLGEVRNRCQKWSYVDHEFTIGKAPDVFRAWNEFQILCAHRRGPRSANAVNQLLDDWMRRRRIGDRLVEEAVWYPGRPILVTENDYELGLFNGDIGITVRDPDRANQLRIVFEKQEGEKDESGIRSITPAQLTHYEPAWALTVHKSQGSEFDDVLLIMPEKASPILTRELIYTALTRARKKFIVWSEERIFKQAVRQQIQRTSALGERLWAPGDGDSREMNSGLTT